MIRAQRIDTVDLYDYYPVDYMVRAFTVTARNRYDNFQRRVRPMAERECVSVHVLLDGFFLAVLGWSLSLALTRTLHWSSMLL